MSENASEYDYSIIGEHWKVSPSLLDKIPSDFGAGCAEVDSGGRSRYHAIDISLQMIDEGLVLYTETPKM